MPGDARESLKILKNNFELRKKNFKPMLPLGLKKFHSIRFGLWSALANIDIRTWAKNFIILKDVTSSG